MALFYGTLPGMRFPTADAKLWLNSQTGYYAAKYKDDRGRWQRVSLQTKDAKVALKRFNGWRRDYLAGKIAPKTPGIAITVSEFADEWVSHISARYSEATFVQYRATATKLKEYFSDTPLADFNQRSIDLLVNLLLKDGLSIPTVNKHRRHLRVMLTTAEEWAYIDRRPKIPRPLREVERVKYFSDEDLGLLFSAITDPVFRDLCHLALVTGLRSGEILRLTPADVDCPRGFLRITEEQKNRTESRIPINSTAREILDRNPGLFPYSSESWVARRFKAYREAAGLPEGLTFHSLRHTYGTMMVRRGADVRVIKELMRHKAITSTMVYAKVTPEHLKESSELMSIDLASYQDRTKLEDKKG